MGLIREGGIFVFPVIAFGVVALGAAVQYLRSHKKELYVLSVGMTMVSFVLGLFGTVTGLRRSVQAISGVAAENRWIFLLGLGESLSSMVLALGIAVLTTLALTLGAYRSQQTRVA